jgi:hypothetical protein
MPALETGALGAWRVRQARTGSIVVSWLPKPRFGTGGSAPTCRASWGIAHLRASRVRPAFIAFAGTSRSVKAAAKVAVRIGNRCGCKKHGGSDRKDVAMEGESAVR